MRGYEYLHDSHVSVIPLFITFLQQSFCWCGPKLKFTKTLKPKCLPRAFFITIFLIPGGKPCHPPSNGKVLECELDISFVERHESYHENWLPSLQAFRIKTSRRIEVPMLHWNWCQETSWIFRQNINAPMATMFSQYENMLGRQPLDEYLSVSGSTRKPMARPSQITPKRYIYACGWIQANMNT